MVGEREWLPSSSTQIVADQMLCQPSRPRHRLIPPGVQFVQKVPIVQTPSFILPRDAGEDRGEGLNVLNRCASRLTPDRHSVVVFPRRMNNLGYGAASAAYSRREGVMD